MQYGTVQYGLMQHIQHISPIVDTMSSSPLLSQLRWGSLLERDAWAVLGVVLCFVFRETWVAVGFEAFRVRDSIRETKSSSDELSGHWKSDEGLGMVDWD